MTGIVVAFYATLQPLREDGLVRVVETVVPLAAASEVCLAAGQFSYGGQHGNVVILSLSVYHCQLLSATV